MRLVKISAGIVDAVGGFSATTPSISTVAPGGELVIVRISANVRGQRHKTTAAASDAY
jgi:hypothetical protein